MKTDSERFKTNPYSAQPSSKVATIDFHVTSECSGSCSYCWGPQRFEHPVDEGVALRIISRVKEVGARRIVFTGGDPLKRSDIGLLIRHAKRIGLEVALSTTGDELTREFLETIGSFIDLISLPIDGPTEEVNSRTKQPGQFTAVMHALEWLRDHPSIDIKICTAVTQHNLAEIPRIVNLVEQYARTTNARVFYNIFQTFPRSMHPVDWDELLVTDEEFAVLQQQHRDRAEIRLNFLSHEAVDGLYVMIFPDGRLVIPRGPDFVSFGQFLEIKDFDAVLDASQFDSAKHMQHSQKWTKNPEQ